MRFRLSYDHRLSYTNSLTYVTEGHGKRRPPGRSHDRVTGQTDTRKGKHNSSRRNGQDRGNRLPRRTAAKSATRTAVGDRGTQRPRIRCLLRQPRLRSVLLRGGQPTATTVGNAKQGKAKQGVQPGAANQTFDTHAAHERVQKTVSPDCVPVYWLFRSSASVVPS